MRNKGSALAALAVAGGLWAWKNRDQIRGWMNSSNNPLNSMTNSNQQPSYTGETRRFEPNQTTTTPNEPFTTRY